MKMTQEMWNVMLDMLTELNPVWNEAHRQIARRFFTAFGFSDADWDCWINEGGLLPSEFSYKMEVEK